MSASFLVRTLVIGAAVSGCIALSGRTAFAEPVCNFADSKPYLVSQAVPILGRPKTGASTGALTGMVTVDVSLDVLSHVSGTAVSSSTNPLLDAAVPSRSLDVHLRHQRRDGSEANGYPLGCRSLAAGLREPHRITSSNELRRHPGASIRFRCSYALAVGLTFTRCAEPAPVVPWVTASPVSPRSFFSQLSRWA